ncbi:hypothetical protein pb186bvf_006922 [Paramecium bursaria]
MKLYLNIFLDNRSTRIYNLFFCIYIKIVVVLIFQKDEYRISHRLFELIIVNPQNVNQLPCYSMLNVTFLNDGNYI